MARAPIKELLAGSGGLGNLFRREFRVWWGSRFGIWQVLIWLLAINGIWAIILGSEEETGFEPFFGVASIFTAIGVVVLAQGSIVGEKKTGTAAWILSGPVSRRAFLLSKLIPLAIGSLVLMVALPGAVGLIEFTGMTGDTVELGLYVAGLGVLWLYLLFFVSLTIMLGTFFQSRGPVMGVAFGVMAGAMIPANLLPWQLYAITPWSLGQLLPPAIIAGNPLIIDGNTIPTAMPLIATAVLAAVFVAVAMWRFQREDF